MADVYNFPAGSGGGYGGMNAPAAGGGSGQDANTAAWAANAQMNAWMAIPGTEGAGGATMNPYCGWAFDAAKTRFYSAAAGGHGDSPDNRVTGVDLMKDSPSWAVLCASSTGITTAQYDLAYYPDGKPSSRHVYQMAQYVPSVNRIMLLGARYVWSGSGFVHTTVDGFNLDSNQWDPAGYWPNVPGTNGAGIVDGDGYAWNPASGHRLDAVAKSWTTYTLTGYSDGGVPVRHPWAWDSKRGLMVGFCMSDGEGGIAPLNAMAVDPITKVRSKITINASAAFTAWLSEDQQYAGFDYDPVNDFYLFYRGNASNSKIYKIIPNNTFNWDMEIFTVAAGSASLPVANQGGGINNRWTYAPQLKGFVCMPLTESPMYFMKTSN